MDQYAIVILKSIIVFLVSVWHSGVHIIIKMKVFSYTNQNLMVYNYCGVWLLVAMHGCHKCRTL